MTTQHFLDPRDTTFPTGTGVWIPPGPIPIEVRKFGYYPNIDDWLPGDLILVSNIQPNLSHKVITSVQLRGGYALDDARWHHAAVYLGNGDICEADLPGIGCRGIDRYVKVSWRQIGP